MLCGWSYWLTISLGFSFLRLTKFEKSERTGPRSLGKRTKKSHLQLVACTLFPFFKSKACAVAGSRAPSQKKPLSLSLSLSLAAYEKHKRCGLSPSFSSRRG